ncbi:hypothetical protein AQUCO_03700332v1 [Aquilegia coerulea]|uniref:Uncharacterized protein n=1 Tax=Aquilegia coerulea TaxID=218851 RepID=A0A2G5CUQ2_AQUCA|nr:hypothetical protein AQUCO_03700332v1 [Aquilegia coerulea]
MENLEGDSDPIRQTLHPKSCLNGIPKSLSVSKYLDTWKWFDISLIKALCKTVCTGTPGPLCLRPPLTVNRALTIS